MTVPIRPAAIPLRSVPPIPAPDAGHGLPLWRLGFRPFYLGAAALAALLVPLWVGLLTGALTFTTPVAPLLWHAHEMLYGFAVAVIAGFLLTAGQAWTGLATPRGPALAGLWLTWLAARLAAFGPSPWLYALLDLALLPLVAAVLLRLLLRSGNRRNLPLAGLLVLLALANAAFHATTLGLFGIDARTPLHAALALVVMIEVVMAGRVVPAFTMNATPGLRLLVPRHLPLATQAATAVALLAWLALPASASGIKAWPLAVAALLQAALLWHWRPGVTRGRPILWILHAACAWLPVGLCLLALAALGLLPDSTGIHALAVGTTGALVMGMITRTARGHTGRPLTVSRLETLAYALVLLAALLRIFLPMLAPAPLAWIAAATAWSGAFALYLWRYLPWLCAPRLDGRDG